MVATVQLATPNHRVIAKNNYQHLDEIRSNEKAGAAIDYGTQLTDSQAYKHYACCKMQQAECLSS
jgi:hypothetical protein